MEVIFAPEAQADLIKIWNWNAKERGVSHADNYLNYLGEKLEGLAESYTLAKHVPGRQDLWYLDMRRRRRGHGHLAVFTIYEDRIVVVHVFHSAQDWTNRLNRD